MCNNNQVGCGYDSADAAYIFEGLSNLRKKAIQRTDKSRWFGDDGGELFDYAFMFERSIAAARALEQLIDEREYDRLAVFAYEYLDADSSLIQMLFDQPDTDAKALVAAWCEDQKILVKQDAEASALSK